MLEISTKVQNCSIYIFEEESSYYSIIIPISFLNQVSRINYRFMAWSK